MFTSLTTSLFFLQYQYLHLWEQVKNSVKETKVVIVTISISDWNHFTLGTALGRQKEASRRKESDYIYCLLSSYEFIYDIVQ